MTRTNITSSLFAAVMTVAFALPYAAPAICSMLDRPGFGMTITAPGDESHMKPAAPDMCCSLERCGTPKIAPSTFELPDVAVVPEGAFVLVTPPLSRVVPTRTPLTPPPEA